MSSIKESLAGRIVTLTDGATVDIDASVFGPRGGIARLSSVTNPTINAPTNPTDGQTFTLEFTASSAIRTLTLTTGSSGAFAFSTDIATITQTAANTTDRLGFVYRSSASRWWLTCYLKGF